MEGLAVGGLGFAGACAFGAGAGVCLCVGLKIFWNGCGFVCGLACCFAGCFAACAFGCEDFCGAAAGFEEGFGVCTAPDGDDGIETFLVGS